MDISRHRSSPSVLACSLAVLVVLSCSWRSALVQAGQLGDCASICHRTGMLGRFAGCRCSLTLFTKRGGDRISRLEDMETRQFHLRDDEPLDELAASETGDGDPELFIIPKSDLLMASQDTYNLPITSLVQEILSNRNAQYPLKQMVTSRLGNGNAQLMPLKNNVIRHQYKLTQASKRLDATDTGAV